MFLSFLGGARGDFLFAFLLTLVLFIVYKPLFSLCIVSFGIIFVFTSGLTLEYLSDNFLIVERLLLLESDYLAKRGDLLEQSLLLVSDDRHCLVFGCGFGYFQKYFGYAYGMYPHNFWAEFFITFGIPISVFTLGLVVIGVIVRVKQVGLCNSFIAMGFYTMMISLKSGTFFSFLTLGYVTYFFISAICILTHQKGGALVRQFVIPTETNRSQ